MTKTTMLLPQWRRRGMRLPQLHPKAPSRMMMLKAKRKDLKAHLEKENRGEQEQAKGKIEKVTLS
jgi:hypothetical protein